MSTIIDNDSFLVRNLKGLLQEKLWLLEERLKQKRFATTYKSFTDAEARILATLRGESLTISEVSRKLNVSRQAVHKTVSNLVGLGLLILKPASGNARDKYIEFTKKGEVMKKAAAKALDELEHEVKAAIGANNLRLLKSLLEKEW